MINLSNISTSLLIGILSPVLLAIGYFYRSRQESKKSKKIALYMLMEIWHRMSVFYRRNFDDAFEQIFMEIKKQFPNESISESEIEASKAHFTPILMETARKSALSDLDGYQEKYQQVVALISPDDPIFAYKISSASKTKRFLNFLDSYLNKSLEVIEKEGIAGMTLSETLKTHVTEHVQLDSIKDLESDIRRLSLKISLYTYTSCILAIRKRKKKLNKLSENDIENLVANVLAPAMKEFNKKMQPTPNGAA